MIFESHAHYDDHAFDEDRHQILSSMAAQGVGTIIDVSSSKSSLARVASLTKEYPFIYGAFGLHPDEIGHMTDDLLEEIRLYSRSPKAVAIGEIGLDYYWDKEHHKLQKYWFSAQAEVGREEKLPIIIHSREAAADTLDIVKSFRGGEIGGVIHCYSYSVEMAREYLNMGFYLGIGGVLTFKNAKKLKDVVAYAPLSQLLLETDSPYLAPSPFRGKRNNSSYIHYVAQVMADIKNLSVEEVIQTTETNGKKLFSIQ